MIRSRFNQHLRRATLFFPIILSDCNMLSTTPSTRDISLGDLDIFAGSFDHGYGIWFNDGVGYYEH